MSDRKRREQEFVRNVLDRTSGSPCQRAEELLPGLVEHRLEDLDRQLVQSHLEHCPGCRAVALALGWLGELLPELAELDPGEAFTAGVLAGTTGASSEAEKAVRAGHTIGPAGLVDRLGRWWQRQIERPQFALQFAYVATVILVLLTALPISPFKEAPGKALAIAQAGPGSVPFFGQAQTWVDRRVEGVLAIPREAITGSWQAFEEDLAERNARSRPPRQDLGAHLNGAVDRLAGGELGEAGYELMQSARSGKQAWLIWWQDNEDAMGTEGANENRSEP